MNYLTLKPFKLTYDSLILVEISQKFNLEPKQLMVLLRFYNKYRCDYWKEEY